MNKKDNLILKSGAVLDGSTWTVYFDKSTAFLTLEDGCF